MSTSSSVKPPALRGVLDSERDPRLIASFLEVVLLVQFRLRLRINPVTGLAEAQRALGRDEEALQSYQAAIRAIERVRAGVGSEEERRIYFGGRAHVYADALALLWRDTGTTDGKEIELWNLAEAYRARTFIERLEEQAVDPDRLVSPELVSERSEILARHNRLHSQLISRMSGMLSASLPRGFLGIGDDCAITDTPRGSSVVVSTDAIAEGTHFLRFWTTPFQLGSKAIGINSTNRL